MQTEQDLEKLVRAYTAPLLRYCTALLGSAQDAQDAVQTTFVKAWLHRGSLRGGGQDNERAWLYRTTEWTPPEGMSSEEATEYLQELDRQNQYPVGFTVSWASEYPHLYPSYLRLRRVNRVAGQLGDYVIDLEAIAALSYEHVPAGTTLSNHEVWFTRESALTWENEEYTTDLGIVALMPHCTSYQEPGYRDTYAFFTWDGIYYRLNAWSPNGWEDGMTADARAVLKQVLDSFTPPETAP